MSYDSSQLGAPTLPSNESNPPSCCSIGACLTYNWSPNWLMLFSSTDTMSSLSWANTARTARRIATPSPSAAPEKLVSQSTRCILLFLSAPTMWLRAPAAADITVLLSSDSQSPRSVRCCSARILKTVSKTLRCSVWDKLSRRCLKS